VSVAFGTVSTFSTQLIIEEVARITGYDRIETTLLNDTYRSKSETYS